MLFHLISKNTKKYAKPLLRNYCKLFSNKKVSINNKEFFYNKNANAYLPFKKNRTQIREQIKNYNKISKEIFLEIGHKTYNDKHPKIKDLYPSACSWVPYYENQSNLVFTNFLSTHYGLNNPQIILLRYEVQSHDTNEIIEKFKTVIVLPEQTIWFNEKFLDQNSNRESSKGQLFLYTFDPLFRPGQKQVRYHVVYENKSYPTSGVHSWVAYKDELVISHAKFLNRRFLPFSEKKNEYFMVPPFGKIVACEEENKLEDKKTQNHDIIKVPAELKPKECTQRGGYFLNLDKENYINRVWHDNGSGNGFYAEKKLLLNKSVKETDFCFPLQGYYFNLVVPNPVGNNLLLEKNIKISAQSINQNKVLLEEKIENCELIKPTKKFYAFEIKLKKFFEKLNNVLSEDEKAKNEFIKINFKFDTNNSNKEAFKDEIVTYIYMYDDNDNICDQLHNEFTSGSIFGGKKFQSYRTNKFAPFKIKKNCNSFVVLKNKFEVDDVEKKVRYHKLRVTINYTENNTSIQNHYNKTEYVNFDVTQKCHLINIKDLFFKDDKSNSEIVGGIHIFSSTLNSWCYWMIKSENESGRKFLACDHLTGG